MTDIGMKRALGVGYDDALRIVPEALAREGFGVLTEIDIQQTLKKKLDVDFRRYKILGACNPALAHRALQTSLAAGVMLPCNVIVYEDDERRAHLLIVDPLQTLAASHEALRPVAEDAHKKLAAVLNVLPAAL